MNSCESHEVLVSTLLDEGLDPREQIECLDHLARCEACRGFYLDARALDGLVAAVRTPAEAEPPSAEIWKRIEWQTTRERRRGMRRFLPTRSLQAAAVFVVAIGVSILAWNGLGTAPAPEEAEIVLGGGDDMTEQRFVELTREVLQADRRYHSAMFRIMEQVVRDTAGSPEASADGSHRRSEEREAVEDAESTGQTPA